MPTASGSLAFLGAARFQGYWDATTNSATGSGLSGQKLNGVVNGLFSTGSSSNAGGYANATGLTASIGDYWQVTGSGTHNVDGSTSWAINDWCVYSGSAGSSGNWSKLSFDDTIASIVVGDLAGSTVFNLTGSSDKQILFITGATDAHVIQSGSDSFVFDYSNNRVGIGTSSPDTLLELSNDASTELSVTSFHNSATQVPKLSLRKARGTSASPAIVQDGDTIGYINFQTNDGADDGFHSAARISAKIDGTPGSGDLPARLHFITSDDGEASATTSNIRMTIKNDGKVGIGTITPDHILSVTGALGTSGNLTVSGTAHFAHLTASSLSSSYYGDGTHLSNVNATTVTVTDNESTDETNAIVFTAGGDLDGGNIGLESDGDLTYNPSSGLLTATNINCTQRIGIGTDSPGADLHIVDDGPAHAEIETFSDSAETRSTVSLRRARGSTTSAAVVQDGDDLGCIEFNGYDGSDTETQGAAIDVLVDGTPSTNNMPARMIFKTNDNTGGVASAAIERMTIKSDGKIGIATNSPEHTLSVTGTLGVSSHTTVSGTLYANHLTASSISSSFYGDGAHLSNVPSVANGANDRIATFSSADALNGEANLTFSSANLLTVVGNITASTNVSASAFYGQELHATNIDLSAQLSDVLIRDNSTHALQFREGSNDYLIFSTFDTKERVIFDKDLIIKDDIKLLVGGSSLTHEAEIFYNETGDDFMVVSGSAKGIAISGSTIDVDGRMAIGRQSTGTTGLPEHTLSVTGTLGVSGDTTVSGTLHSPNINGGSTLSLTGSVIKLEGNTIQIGGNDNLDVSLLFDGDTNDGILKWKEDEDYFEFLDNVVLTNTNLTVAPGASGGTGLTVTHTDVDQNGITINATNTTTGGSLLINHDDDTTAAADRKTSFAIDFDKTGVQAQSTTASFVASEIIMVDSANNHAGGTVHMTGSTIFVTSSHVGGLNTTNTGLRVITQGADTNYDALFLGGNVGIGDSAPLAKLSVVANSPNNTALFVRNDGNDANRNGIFISCGKDAPGTNGDIIWLLLADGDSDGTSGVISRIRYDTGGAGAVLESASDKRIKTDIKPSEVNALEILNNIPLSEFRMAKKNNPVGELNRVGFVAQDCEEAWPEMVSEMEDSDYAHKIKTVAPATLIPVLVKAVQELSAEIEALKNK